MMRNETDNVHVLDNIPINLQADEVLKRLQMRSANKRIEEMVRELIDIVGPVMRPKALYKSARINTRNGDVLEIDGVEFTCHALRVFDKSQMVFPYVATCGQEIDSVKFPDGGPMKAYCMTIIKNMVVNSAANYVQDHLVKEHSLKQISSISPGHPASWPIKQREALFPMLGNVEDLIGVRLTDTYLMMPVNSVAGILYPTEVRIERCHVCPSDTCRERRTPYNPSVLE